MSYASFTKSFPNLIKSVPEKLSQPTSIAVMASIGIHVVVGLSLPYLPSFSREKSPSRRTVQLTQLSPQEQSRLPQLSPPPLPPAVSTQIQPLESLPPTLSSLPPLPKDSSLYNFPLSSLPSTSPRSTSRSSTSNRFSFSPLPSFSRQPSRIKFPVRNSPIWTRTNRATSLPVTPIQPRSLPGGLPAAPLPPFPSFPDTTTATPPVFLPTTPTPPPPQPPTSQQPIPQPSSTPTRPTQTTVAANGSTPPAPSNTPATQTPGTSRTQTLIAQRVQDIRQIQQSLRPDSSNTTSAEAMRNDVASRAKVQQAEPEIQRREGTYPKAACLKQLEGTAVHNVLVDASGKTAQIDLIRSAGYQIFNQQASQEISSRSFRNTTGAPKLYQVYTSFEYSKEICPALRSTERSNERQNSPEPQNSPKPENSNERQNSPEPQNSPKPENSNERQNSPEPQNSPRPENSNERQNSPEPQNSPRPENTPDE
ncbi:energy transducer TonB [Microcoleus sp. FACHB-SPT15]|uniref:energy transducer TonB n=1 Tax=Microcoleus sp. FACHB-SPT15 TaxID=2692830 RepID=UPI00177AEA2F|nr:energy transducer TonB [Microcoleus sp. FACHB-SPT15]MBD1809413.1 energy transducer TonB [Microcoleus sp. FACHB-SPT15]